MLLTRLRRRRRQRREQGFTLVELLVVMFILGVLASIAIPSFFSQRDKARDASAKAAVRTAQTALSTYATDNEGEYTDATVPDLISIEATLVGADLTIDAADADGYTVTVASATGNAFTATRNLDGTVDLTCTVPGDGGCPATGVWG